MPDNKKKKGKPDRDRVNKGERYEVAYEAKKMKVPKAKVIAAAKKAGPMRKNIEAALRKGKR
jgi:hypothetical protein